MTIVTREELTTLITHEADLCVSLFMPTHNTGREQQQDPIRLKNLLAETREQLTERGISGDAASDLLDRVESLRNDVTFWTSRQDGLALFCAEGLFRSYQLPLLPESYVHVNSRFYVRPLIQLLHGNSRFFVLALSQDDAHLFAATKYSIRDLNLEAALATVKQSAAGHAAEQTLQFRTLAKESAGKGPGLFHGHGGAADVSKQDILKYFQAVDRAVSKLLRDENAPLVLACVGYLASLYESTNSYSGLIKGKVPGNPHMWDEDELRDRAWELASPVLNQHREQALNRFDKSVGTEKVATDVRKVVLAASEGRVDTLFLEKGRKVWGNIDRVLQAVHIHADDVGSGEELLDYSAACTLIHGGSVYSLDRDRLPTDGPVAALLRYAA